MAYEDYVIEDFMNAWFKKDYSVLSEEDFKIVYSEYLDTSGLFLSDDFEKQSYIHHLHTRIEYVKMYIKSQRSFIKNFGVPYSLSFENFKNRYGHFLLWKDDKTDFENQLVKIEKREQKNISLLEGKIKELQDLRSKNSKNKLPIDKEESLAKSRVSFIRMMNSLGKIGYKISRKETYVDELSIMIKQQLEENQDNG